MKSEISINEIEITPFLDNMTYDSIKTSVSIFLNILSYVRQMRKNIKLNRWYNIGIFRLIERRKNDRQTKRRELSSGKQKLKATFIAGPFVPFFPLCIA